MGDICREGASRGLHRAIVELGLRWGILLFITSEVFFFLSFFWAYFHARLAPNIEVGGVWPPAGVVVFNPFGVPLLNTIILVSSGVTVTWAHHAIIIGDTGQLELDSLLLFCWVFILRVYRGWNIMRRGFLLLMVFMGQRFSLERVSTGFM